MSANFDPDSIPNLAGKVILITGGTAGLGAGSACELARHDPLHIIFTGRNADKAAAVVERMRSVAPNIKATFISLDISSFSSVREGAAKIMQHADRLDIVMLNAGIMATPPALSKDGYEMQFATNHLGHALLVKLLLPMLQRTAASADVRVINLTSIAYGQAPKGGIDFAGLRSDQASLGGMGSSIAKWRRYGQSKLAQLLYTEQLAEHYPSITWISIHPGIIMTDLFGNVDFMTKLPVLLMSLGRRTPVEKGHYNQCWAATCDKSKLVSGQFYEPVGVVGTRSTSYARDLGLGKRLYDWTEQELRPIV